MIAASAHMTTKAAEPPLRDMAERYAIYWQSSNTKHVLGGPGYNYPMTDPASMLRARLALADPVHVEFQRRDLKDATGFRRERIEYLGLEGDVIPAFLFTPTNRETLGGVV